MSSILTVDRPKLESNFQSFDSRPCYKSKLKLNLKSTEHVQKFLMQ